MLLDRCGAIVLQSLYVVEHCWVYFAVLKAIHAGHLFANINRNVFIFLKIQPCLHRMLRKKLLFFIVSLLINVSWSAISWAPFTFCFDEVTTFWSKIKSIGMATQKSKKFRWFLARSGFCPWVPPTIRGYIRFFNWCFSFFFSHFLPYIINQKFS